MGVSPWPRGLHLRLLFPARPSACRRGPGCQHSPAAAAALPRGARPARACPRSPCPVLPSPGRARRGRRAGGRAQTEAARAGFLAGFLEPGPAGSHTLAAQLHGVKPRPHAGTRTRRPLPATALGEPRTPFPSGPLPFPIHSRVGAAGCHLLQEAFPPAPAQVDGGPFTGGCRCPRPALHPTMPRALTWTCRKPPAGRLPGLLLPRTGPIRPAPSPGRPRTRSPGSGPGAGLRRAWLSGPCPGQGLPAAPSLAGTWVGPGPREGDSRRVHKQPGSVQEHAPPGPGASDAPPCSRPPPCARGTMDERRDPGPSPSGPGHSGVFASPWGPPRVPSDLGSAANPPNPPQVSSCDNRSKVQAHR